MKGFIALWIGGVLVVAFGLSVQAAWATPASGVTATPIVDGQLGEPIPLELMPDGMSRGLLGSSVSTQVEKVSVVRFVGEPGASFGWHQHGGPLWAVITEGALTLYHGNDPQCRPTVYQAGSAFLDPGDHTHLARNEGSGQVEVLVTFMLPSDGALRIDAPDPGVCAF